MDISPIEGAQIDGALPIEGAGARIRARVDDLAALSQDPARLTRVFLSPQHRQANERVASWMKDAGMAVHIDSIGNVVGRYEGARMGMPALMLGSHLDTVEDAGRYDGMLGVVTAIACVDALHRAGRRLPFAIEIVGFCDEEGVRFGVTMLGSRAVAGTFDPGWLGRTDAKGVSMAQALRGFGLDPDSIGAAARRRDEILAYVELHIEQGPVLEARGLAVGCVTSIAGATRLEVDVTGVAGHAGTVPMGSRRDAVAAAAECVLAVERRCGAEDGLVGTVGRIAAMPGAINVIAGRAQFTIDARAPDDAQRKRCVDDLLREMATIAARRGVSIAPRLIHELPAAPSASWLMHQVDCAIAAAGISPFRLSSGAGHDGMAIKEIADIGMVFVRCAGGISHNPAESVTTHDMEVGARVLMNFIMQFQAKDPV
jgi:allantoate deiminase